MPVTQACVVQSRAFSHPRLLGWSINLIEDQLPELTGLARADAEREARISLLGKLVSAGCASRAWRAVCKHEMYREIGNRSASQRLAMELALQESLR